MQTLPSLQLYLINLTDSNGSNSVYDFVEMAFFRNVQSSTGILGPALNGKANIKATASKNEGDAKAAKKDKSSSSKTILLVDMESERSKDLAKGIVGEETWEKMLPELNAGEHSLGVGVKSGRFIVLNATKIGDGDYGVMALAELISHEIGHTFGFDDSSVSSDIMVGRGGVSGERRFSSSQSQFIGFRLQGYMRADRTCR
jgi:hypothetical protein